MNNELFPWKYEQFDQSVDKIIHTFCHDVDSVLGKSMLQDIVILPWKYGQYVY